MPPAFALCAWTRCCFTAATRVGCTAALSLTTTGAVAAGDDVWHGAEPDDDGRRVARRAVGGSLTGDDGRRALWRRDFGAPSESGPAKIRASIMLERRFSARLLFFRIGAHTGACWRCSHGHGILSRAALYRVAKSICSGGPKK
jgi:hypothetical protein